MKKGGVFGGDFGALGAWEKIGEKPDSSIVKQEDGTCVAAVGEMLAKYHGLQLTQEEIIEKIGAWANAEKLVAYLNSRETRKGVKWKGGYSGISDKRFIIGITEDITVWGVMLRDAEAVGHAVLIYGKDAAGLIKIKDPYDQTKYKMTVDELYRVLSEIVVVVKEQ
jgi:ABC-type bacteriocin/lantibiotic exporter with double-glycine peptidase domain